MEEEKAAVNTQGSAVVCITGGAASELLGLNALTHGACTHIIFSHGINSGNIFCQVATA